MENRVILEKAASQVAIESSKPPLIFELPVDEGRRKLEEAQSTPVYKYDVNITSTYYDTLDNGIIKLFILYPKSCEKLDNVIFYIHGAGWVFGSFHTHEKLVRELCFKTNSIVIFPEYSRSPEVRYPVALKQCYRAFVDIPNILNKVNLNTNINNLFLAGDSVGGNMSIVLTLMAKNYNGPKISKLLVYYPVTNDDFNTESYLKFKEGYYLYRDGMKWFWNQYIPNKDDRNYITATPLKASLEQLKDFPPTMIINGEADVLRTEGEQFASKLMEAGVDVSQIRFKGMIHDFVMLNALDQTNACRGAMEISTAWLNGKYRE